MGEGQLFLAKLAQLPVEPEYDAQRRTLGREARDMFAEARGMFQQAETNYSDELEKLPPASSEDGEGTGNRRQEYRGRVAQLRYLAAQTQFESARTYPADADEFKKLNESAAAELSSVFEEFGRSANSYIGLFARLAEGRCYQALGRFQEALGCYNEILSGNNVLPPFRKLVATAVHRKAEVLIAQEKYDEALQICNACLRDAKDDEEKQAEWLGVRFRLAEALQKKGEGLASDSLEARKLFAEARDAYRVVALSPGEFQPAARTAAAELAMGGKNGKGGGDKQQPKSFQAAYDLGKDALASYNAAKLAYPSAEKNNPDALPELQAQMKQGKEDARRNFRAATTLVDDDTDLKLLNEVRYFLCWLYWENQDYYRAAVLGEFLARRFPDHAAAASAAKLAMASYERLYSQATNDSKKADGANTDFEAAKMAELAEFIVRRWPGSDDADAAQNVLVSIAIQSNRIEDAEKLLAAASEESRPRLELQLGNAMWARYLGLSQGMGQETAPDPENLAHLRESAIKYLRSGFAAARDEGEPSESTAAGGLYLVQALLNDEKYGEAVELLEDEQVGPLALVRSEHPAASNPVFVVETYKAALRAYVLSIPPDEEKAQAIMKSLEDAVAAGGGSGEQLTQVYISLGMVLSKHATQLREAGRGGDAARINSAFAQFLDRIAARQESANWPTRVWLAQTYYEMGASERAGLPPAPLKPLSEPARGSLTKARDAYQQLLADAAKDPKLPPSEVSVLAAQMQLGDCLRALGEYKRALDTFSAVLKERESSLDAQKAAARTYQERAEAEDARWYENAIHGGYKLKSTGQNRIWGWLKISAVAARLARNDAKYFDMFLEARYNVARCRFLAALSRNGEQRKHDLAKAKQSIQSVFQVYDDRITGPWRSEFDAILKEMQKAAGQKQIGLTEFSTDQSTTNTGGE
jgi:tetratricopeptide (TPR) repeat protein